jgi:hypothetical protein
MHFGEDDVGAIKSSVFVLFFSMSCAWSQPLASSYANLFETGRAVLVVMPKSVAISDLELPAHRCMNTDKFECVISKHLVFSIPRNGRVINKWSRLGADYKVLSRREIILKGELIDYLVIRQTVAKSVVDFLYSDKLGVIGLKALNGLELSLLEERGFAAIAPRTFPRITCVPP